MILLITTPIVLDALIKIFIYNKKINVLIGLDQQNRRPKPIWQTTLHPVGSTPLGLWYSWAGLGRFTFGPAGAQKQKM
jgi:hypothetical protein